MSLVPRNRLPEGQGWRPGHFWGWCLPPGGRLVSVSPVCAPVASCLSKTLPKSAGRSDFGFYQITASALDPRVCEILYEPFKSKVSIAPALLAPESKPLQSQCPWAVEHDLGLRQLTPLGEPLVIILLFIVNPPRVMGLDCIKSLPFLSISLWFLPCIFSCGYFPGGSSLFGWFFFFFFFVQMVVILVGRARMWNQGLSTPLFWPISLHSLLY